MVIAMCVMSISYSEAGVHGFGDLLLNQRINDINNISIKKTNWYVK